MRSYAIFLSSSRAFSTQFEKKLRCFLSPPRKLVNMGCLCTKAVKCKPVLNLRVLASETNFTLNEVEALYELLKTLNHSMTNTGFIHKIDFQHALVRSGKHNLFSDRLFDLFDEKKKGVIGFVQFVRSLGSFHSNASEEEKISNAFKLFDLNCTGFIERDDLMEMLIALLDELDLKLTDDVLESIVNVTFSGVDLNGNGKIDKVEWMQFAKELTMALPSFVVNTQVDEIDMRSSK